MAETSRPKAQTAGIGIRLLSGLYDAALLVGVGFLAFIPVSIVEQQTGTAPDWIKQLLFMSVAYGYFVGFWYKDGATTGMRPWKLRLAMAESGDPLTLMAATVRFFGLALTWLAFMLIVFYTYAVNANNIEIFNRLFSAIPRQMIAPVFLLFASIPAISLFCMLMTKRRQALHDLIAGTGIYRIRE